MRSHVIKYSGYWQLIKSRFISTLYLLDDRAALIDWMVRSLTAVADLGLLIGSGYEI